MRGTDAREYAVGSRKCQQRPLAMTTMRDTRIPIVYPTETDVRTKDLPGGVELEPNSVATVMRVGQTQVVVQEAREY